MSTPADHDAIDRELHQLQLARLDVDYQSRDGAVAIAASHAREAELWRALVQDRGTDPLLCRAAARAWTAAEELAKFWREHAEQETSGRPA
jgi:hypothetical protein